MDQDRHDPPDGAASRSPSVSFSDKLLNFYTWRDAQGQWQRTRAITLAVEMRTREQIGQFGAAVDQALAAVKPHLPDDLIIARTSDQPRQVQDNIELFMG